MTKEVLGNKPVKELRNIARDWEVTGRWDMTKEELVTAILEAEKECEGPVKTESAKVEEEIGNKREPKVFIAEVVQERLEKTASDKKEVVKETKSSNVVYVDAEVYESGTTAKSIVEKENVKVLKELHKKEVKVLSEAQIEEKLEYIKRITKGSLIAFRIGDKVKSAMVTNKSTARGLVKAENKVKTEFIIPFDDILWVKTGKRWPRGVYDLLKGGPQHGSK